MSPPRYPRDLLGYGRTPPDPQWPNPGGHGAAKICVQFVVNYEEGGENSILHDDPASEVASCPRSSVRSPGRGSAT